MRQRCEVRPILWYPSDTRHGMSNVSSIASPIGVRGTRNALLVFADPVALDLHRRGWSRSAAPLLQLSENRFSSGAATEWDVHFFSSGPVTGPLPAQWEAHRQRGRGFGERIDNALSDLCAQGYDHVVVVGRDCPELTTAEIGAAFARLGTDCSLVLGPDWGGGCYLIGIRATDVNHLRGISWRRNTDRAEIASRFPTERTYLLPAKFDLDSTVDLAAFAARSVHRAARLALRFLAVLHATWGGVGRRPAVRFDGARHFQRICWQLPPPSGSALTA